MIPTCSEEGEFVLPLGQETIIKPHQTTTQDVKTMKLTVHELQLRLNHLYQLLARPNTITLHKFDNLQLQSVSHSDIKQRVNILFFEAKIPGNWKTKVKWTHPTPTKTDVHITFLNYFVKERALELLLNFFQNNYNKIVYTD